MKYKLHFTLKSLFAFLALLFVCHELHELFHTTVAYWQCGCWGQRDFNAWQVCTTCPPVVNTIWATAVGPLFTYLMIWTGWLLMNKRNNIEQQSFGFALVWANVPFARLFTVLMKGGDEGVIAKAIVGQSKLPIGIWLLEIAVILLLVTPAFVRAWQLLAVQKRVWAFISFLIGPMLMEFISMHKIGNQLLANDVLAQPGILGSPLLINIWNSIWLVLLLVSFSNLGKLFQSKQQIAARKKEVQNF
jgi:hypothetical protein